MGMIDLENFEKLPPEMQKQFSELLKQHPQLDSKLKGASHELNTPTRLENLASDDDDDDSAAMDYSSMGLEEVPSNKPKAPTLRVSEQPSPEDMEREERKEKISAKKKKQAKLAEELKQPEEVANFSPVGKQHPVLKKLRASLGMKTFQQTYKVDVGGIKYELLPLVRDTMTKAITLAAINSLNDAEFRANQDLAIIAFAVQTLDNVPIVDVFSIGKEKLEADGSKTFLTELQRKEQGAHALFHELKESPTELADALISYYQQEFPPRELLGPGKVNTMCPAENCTYTRIVNKEEDSYCPYHGAKMAREDQLPDPF